MSLKDLKLPPFRLLFGRFFGRYHVVTFTILVIGGLAVTTFFLNAVVSSASETTTTTEGAVSGFDSSTIQRVDKLSESSGEIKSLNFPSSKRTNPFSE